MEDFKVIKINKTELKLSMFADDILMFMTNPDESIKKVLQQIETFGSFAGFKINISKTEMMYIKEPPDTRTPYNFPVKVKLKKKIQDQRVHASGTGGGPPPQRLILTPLEELLRGKLLPVVVEGLAGDRDIGIYPSQFPPVAPGGHVSPETEQVSSPGSCSSTHLEEHDDEDDDDDAAIDTEMQSSDHEEVPIETVTQPNRPSSNTYDAIVASEGKIVEAENRRHSDLMRVHERMISLQEETISQLSHLHRVFIEVPKQLQKINTSLEALVVQQTQANYLRMTTVPNFNFNTSQEGSLHGGHFSPHASDVHSPGRDVTGKVAESSVHVPDNILPLPSVEILELTPTKEAAKTKKHKQLLLTSFWTQTKKPKHETDQPSVVHCVHWRHTLFELG
ncbi:uncharacterized protein LOC142500993 [Ascaphus truei]|uniref:uncharacterized protein LOC142500993 n=1 Tax=Ascaphus truei TaxID=8439 RepID=UPI003F5A97A4